MHVGTGQFELHLLVIWIVRIQLRTLILSGGLCFVGWPECPTGRRLLRRIDRGCSGASDGCVCSMYMWDRRMSPRRAREIPPEEFAALADVAGRRRTGVVPLGPSDGKVVTTEWSYGNGTFYRHGTDDSYEFSPDGCYPG